jgi:hypothetical protein
MTDHDHDPKHPPPMANVRDLTDEEYDRTYATGTGGHELPPDVLAELSGADDPEAVPPS